MFELSAGSASTRWKTLWVYAVTCVVTSSCASTPKGDPNLLGFLGDGSTTRHQVIERLGGADSCRCEAQERTKARIREMLARLDARPGAFQRAKLTPAEEGSWVRVAVISSPDQTQQLVSACAVRLRRTAKM